MNRRKASLPVDLFCSETPLLKHPLWLSKFSHLHIQLFASQGCSLWILNVINYVSQLQEVINHFAQVRELAKKMLQENHYASKDIKTQKEFLDRGCRSFAMRMNRRRDIILTSLRFHKSAGEVWHYDCLWCIFLNGSGFMPLGWKALSSANIIDNYWNFSGTWSVCCWDLWRWEPNVFVTDWFEAVNGLIIVPFVTVKKDLTQSSRFLSPVVKRNKTSQALLFLR